MLRRIVVPFSCLLFAASGCSSLPGRSDVIQVAGKTYETKLDSEIARYYATGRGGTDASPELDSMITDLERRFAARPPTREELATIAADFSPDFATLFFIRAILRDEPSARRQEAFSRFIEAAEEIPATRDISVIFVPGWFYKENGHETGSDFHRQLALFKRAGIDATLLEIGDNAAVEDNAALIAAALRKLPNDGRRRVVVSASKSGPEVAMALASLGDEESAHIAAWVNIGGAVGGSPLADDNGEGLKCSVVKGILFVKGYTMDGLLSMKTERRRAAMRSARLPSGVFVLNYVPAPMGADVTKRGRDGYDHMKELGPNDGLILLADAVVPGGATVFEPGLDHFLVTDDIDVRTAALVALVDEATRDRTMPVVSKR